MCRNFDVIVVGLGAMGSAVCYHLAQRGVRVLGLEQFDIPHTQGSSHGFSRMIRLAYFEHPDYVPLLRQAYLLWHRLEAETSQKIIHITGGLYMGGPDSDVLEGSLRSVTQHNLPHELLSRGELARRFGQFELPDDYRGLYDHTAGLILPEQAISSHCEMALRHGAELHGHEPVVAWEANGTSVSVRTRRDKYHADHLVMCCGAWTGKMMRDLGVQLTVTRQVMGWVWPKRPERFELGTLPAWLIEHPDGTSHYGFPMLRGNPGFKVACHKRFLPTDPDTVSGDVNDADEQTFRPLLKDYIPEADGPLLSLRVCMYTNTPDLHFIVGFHPQYSNVTMACGFSGHGFKFAAVIGQALADLAAGGKTALPIGFLSIDRFRPAV